MKRLLYIFSFKLFFLGIFFGIIIILIGSFLTDFFIEKSNHRLSKIFSNQKINEKIFFLGNSRSVPFNSENFYNSEEILNLSQNSMNFFQVENVLKAIKEKQQNRKTIFIELTSIIDNEVQCEYSIFYDLDFYFGKSKIKKLCKRNFYFEKFIPVSKINNELFYRIIFYYFFPEKDQAWTNNYKMPNQICENPKTSHLMSHFFKNDSKKQMKKNAKKILDNYADENTNIFFFIAPIYQNINFALNTEIEFISNKFEKLIPMNTVLDENFFSNCEMYADTLHLSKKGTETISKNKIFYLLN